MYAQGKNDVTLVKTVLTHCVELVLESGGHRMAQNLGGARLQKE